MIEIRRYQDASGRKPFEVWFGALDDITAARIALVLARLELGNFSAIKGVGKGVFEIRFQFGPGYRVYCGKDGDRLVILLGGGTKKRQQTDIEEAQVLWREYKQRKASGSLK